MANIQGEGSGQMAKEKKDALVKGSFPLTPLGIDQMSELAEEALASFGVERRDSLRTRLSLEEVLLSWIQMDGLSSTFELEVSRRLGRVNVALSCPGLPRDPMAFESSVEYGSGQVGRSIMENLGLGLVWQYQGARNVVSCSLRKKRRFGQLGVILIALASAMLCGAIGLSAPESWRTFALNTFLNPLFDAFLGCFTCVVGPLMFLSMAWGIVNIGDTKRLGVIGGKLFFRFIVITAVYAALCLAVGVLVFNPNLGSYHGDEGVLSSIVIMLLDIIPSNIVTPFSEGNTIQILFMGGVVGLSVVLLRDRVEALAHVIDQLYAVVRLILGVICSLTPVFVFLSIVCLILEGTFSESLLGLLQVIALSAALAFAENFVETLSMVKLGVNPVKAVGKLARPFLVAFSTASSAATLPTMFDTCKRKLGIDSELAEFALPFGSVVFMPQVANSLIIVSMFAAHLYGVELTIGGLILCVVNAVVLAVAAPPIPGGAITCYSLMFMQLGIPLEALSLAIAADVVLDFVGTAGSLHALLVQLTHGAKRLNMLDEKILKS